MGKKSKKTKRGYRPTKWTQPTSAVKKSKIINPIIAGAVAFTMILVLVVTVAPGGIGNQGGSGAAGASNAPRKVVDSSAQQRITALEEAARNNPRDAGTLINLGDAYYDAGQWAQASVRYSQALEITPENTDVRTDLGVSYYYQGMTSQAVREYNKALEYEPNKRQSLFNLGIALADGTPPDVDGAIAKWQKVIELYPGTDDAKKSQDKISQLKK